MKSDKPFFFYFSKLKFISVLFFIVLYSSAFANQNNLILDSANTAYSKGDYTIAAKLYEKIIGNGFAAPELYFNLGNSYYKTNNIAFAVLNYERAKKLNPDNDDFNFNLKLAGQKIEDKIDTAPQLFLTQWKNSLLDLMTEKGWAVLCILLTAVSLILFAVYVSTRNRGLKQLGFFGGTILIAAGVITFFAAQYKYNITKNGSDAIITAAAITVTGSPSEKGSKLFVIHEGTKVSINQEDAEWSEIKIANGNVGWVKNSQLQKI